MFAAIQNDDISRIAKVWVDRLPDGSWRVILDIPEYPELRLLPLEAPALAGLLTDGYRLARELELLEMETAA